MATNRRKPINRLVHPDTVTLLKSLAANLGISEGRVLDRAVAALAVAESFGAEHLRLRDVAPNGLTLIKKPQGVEVQIERIGRKAFDAEYRQHPQPPDAAEVER